MVILTEICVQCVHSTHIIQGVLVYCFVLVHVPKFVLINNNTVTETEEEYHYVFHYIVCNTNNNNYNMHHIIYIYGMPEKKNISVQKFKVKHTRHHISVP